MESSHDRDYHVPVLLGASIDGLDIKPGGIYIDATFGGGGHSEEILQRLEGGKLLAFDQDDDARRNAEKINDRSFTFCFANFRYLRRFLRLEKIEKVDGILADLGISSHQIDTPKRGFSTRFDAPLDMRMDQNSSPTAADILNSYSEQELHRILGMYGEVKNARTLAAALIRKRGVSGFKTTGQLMKILEETGPKGKLFKYAAQVFQALRIEVNDEMGALEDFLNQTADLIGTGGRLSVISYHSLEDRMVKNLLRSGNLRGKMEKDMYGNLIRPFEPIRSKPIMAEQEEIERNPRARSARLRIGNRL